ncbi:MAG: CRISPR system precrRNA processing endoribonuclease RAMP protein Cas6 [bacterium]|nr:CRISPR system precrRNA processing endoribonuclease RAMP protein Cas6 [bacterium]
MTLRVFPLRLHFIARESVHFPAGKPGNILRGAFGSTFRHIVCDPACQEVKTCERRESCPYARIFEPSATGQGPSGFADWPRPFVFRAGHLDGSAVHPGDGFHFDVNVFEMREPAIQYFIQSFAQIADEGLGEQRGKAHLRAVYLLDADRKPAAQLYDGDTKRLDGPVSPVGLDVKNQQHEASRIRVRFLTATELKAGKQLAEKPHFRVLFGRARDRVSTLRSLYQGGPLAIDFRGMGQRAAAVTMTRCEVSWRDIARRSSRTGHVHPIGGFVGEAEYEGRLTEFLPILAAAQWTGVGRHTVWGKGVVEVERC